jgi:LacI family transcriptional regulator
MLNQDMFSCSVAGTVYVKFAFDVPRSSRQEPLDVNDEFLCNLSQPSMSSVDLGPERSGYQAAALLDEMMSGAKVNQKEVFLPPIGVVARRSTDVIAINDLELAGLIRYIREHACDGIRVDDAMRRSKLVRQYAAAALQGIVGTDSQRGAAAGAV